MRSHTCCARCTPRDKASVMTQRALRTHVHARVLKKLQACCSQLCTAGLGKALLGHVQYLCFTTATWHSSPRSARCCTAKRKETTKVVLDTICDNLLTAYPISAHCSRASRITMETCTLTDCWLPVSRIKTLTTLNTTSAKRASIKGLDRHT